jgi:hypothetical protein
VVSTQDARKLVDQAFEDGALVLGGLLVLQPVDDRFIHRFMRSLAVIRRRTLRAFETAEARAAQVGSGHPAIAEFLRELRGE